MLFLYFISGSTRHYFPSHGRQLTLCWRTSWESHPSEDLSELLSQKYHYEENTNENVDLLLQWILSEEGQYIIEETGYVGVSD